MGTIHNIQNRERSNSLKTQKKNKKKIYIYIVNRHNMDDSRNKSSRLFRALILSHYSSNKRVAYTYLNQHVVVV